MNARGGKRVVLAGLVASALAAAPASGRPSDAGYRQADGTVAVTGYNDMNEMVGAWCRQFEADHPGFRFALDLTGTRRGAAALAAGTTAFAPLGAELSPAQLDEHHRGAGAAPLVFRVAQASLDPRALSGPLAIIVHRSHPLAALTLAEVAEIFSGRDQRHGLRPCGLGPGTALAQFFDDRVLRGRPRSPDFAGYPQSADVIRRVGEDPAAIGYTAALRLTPDVKVLALATGSGSEPVALTGDNLRHGRYPLGRHLLIAFRVPLEPWMRDFISWVLSTEGQALIGQGTRGYGALSPAELAAERARIPGPGS